MELNIPNLLTFARILLIPLVLVIFYLPLEHSGPIAAILFAIAGITDWLDGYLARRLNQMSRFGAFLDPVADKLMVAAALLLIVDKFGGEWITLAAVIIIGREITISALREWMAEVGNRKKVAVSYLGKLKTTAQMFALFFLLYQEPLLGLPTLTIGFVLLAISAVLTLWSMFNYLKIAMK
jgi:CDP-diacylglycerol--glycerol-3-phosphate 3-phosphatidyltransferase